MTHDYDPPADRDPADADDQQPDDARFADLIAEAAELPTLRPSRDLWDGIAARIETPVVTLGASTATTRPAWTRPGRLAAAAALLVTLTAAGTWQVARRTAPTPGAGTAVATTVDAAEPTTTLAAYTPTVRLASTYDQEIAALREILAQRELDLDDMTVRVIDENLRVIDDAIAAARAALEADPASALLTQRLTGAYDMKLDLLRRLATFTEIS